MTHLHVEAVRSLLVKINEIEQSKGIPYGQYMVMPRAKMGFKT